MLRLKRAAQALLKFFSNRSLILTMFLLGSCLISGFTVMQLHIYAINDNGKLTYVTSMKADAEEVLAEENITIAAYDELTITQTSGGKNEIEIDRAFPVTVSADGAVKTLMTTGGKVEDVLKLANIYVGKSDIVVPPLDGHLSEKGQIMVTRIKENTYSTSDQVPFEVESKKTPLLTPGRVKVLQYGEEGILKQTYFQRTINSRNEGPKLIEEEFLKEPQAQIQLVGADVAASTLDPPFEIELDENGNPVQYATVYHNQVATAYSAGPRAWGASGMSLGTGHVAVRSSMIPYGTKLYIKTPDGSFVYGYAIAADTGSGLMSNIIDVDLFFDTYLESCLFGKRTVDIYVLE